MPKVSISESSFSQIISSAIIVSQVDMIREKVVGSKTFVEGGAFLVSDCVFNKIDSKGDGGAILASNPQLELAVIRTGFKLCYSLKNGGAICFDGRVINLTGTCFIGCIAFDKGQAVDISEKMGDSNEMIGIMIYCSFLQCGPSESRGVRSVIFVQHTRQTMHFINESANFVNDIGASLCIAHNVHISLLYSSFGYSCGLNMFWLHKLTKNDVISQCNIIYNKIFDVSGSTSIFAFENSDVSLNGITFIGNVAKKYFIQGSVTFTSCVFDVKLTPDMFEKCQYVVNECYLNELNAKIRPLPQFVTWDCWAMGLPSSTPSRSLVPPDEFLHNSTPGSTVMVVLLIIGIISSFIGYFIPQKPTDDNITGTTLESLNPRNTN